MTVIRADSKFGSIPGQCLDALLRHILSVAKRKKTKEGEGSSSEQQQREEPQHLQQREATMKRETQHLHLLVTHLFQQWLGGIPPVIQEHVSPHGAQSDAVLGGPLQAAGVSPLQRPDGHLNSSLPRGSIPTHKCLVLFKEREGEGAGCSTCESNDTLI